MLSHPGRCLQTLAFGSFSGLSSPSFFQVGPPLLTAAIAAATSFM